MRLISMLVAGLCLAGCGTSMRSPGVRALPGAAGALDYLDPEAEQRAEAHARYANGVLLDLDGHPQAAAQEFYKAALADGENEQLILEVSRRLLHEKMYPEAVEVLERATASEDASGELVARLGLAYALAGETPLAIRANRRAIQIAPNQLHGYRHLAQLYLQQGEAEKAREVLDEAAEQEEVETSYLVELAELYLSFGQVSGVDLETWKSRAVSVLDRAREKGVQNPLVLQKLAEGYYTAGATEQAQEIYVEVLELLPEVPGVREKLIEIYLRREESGRAVPLLEGLVKDNPTNPQAHYLLGAIALEQGESEVAVKHLRSALLLNGDLEPAYYDLASALLNLDQPGKALETMNEAHRRLPEKFALEYYTAVAYNRMGDHASALTHFVNAEVIARATEPERLTYVFYFQLGAVAERTEHFEEAERYFRKCLELSPEFGQALNYLGYMWAEQDVHLDEAREMIEKALESEPENAAYLDSLGWVLFKQGDHAQAQHYVELAIEKSERPDPTLFDHLGEILMKLQEPEKARQAWQKSLELEANEEIEQKLKASSQKPNT